MRKTRYSTLRPAILLMVSFDALYRLFYGIRPIDWLVLVVDVLILLFIVPGELARLIHWLRVKRRSRIYKYFVEGQALYRSIPVQGADDQVVTAWNLRVTEWNDATNKQLVRHSLRASASFLQDHVHQFGTRYPDLARGAWNEFRLLRDRIDNLRTIMENPDVYF